MSEVKAQSKEEIVVAMVKEGGHTREEIKEAAECTSGSLASYLSAMRNAAKFTGASICPVETMDDEGKKTFSTTTFDEAEEAKAARATSRPAARVAKSPAERLEAAQKRITRCEKAAAAARDRSDKDTENHELTLRANKADIELELAQIELARTEEVVASEPVDEAAVEAMVEDELM